MLACALLMAPALAGGETARAGDAIVAAAEPEDEEEVLDEFGDPVPTRRRDWPRPRGVGLGLTLLGENGLRFNAGLGNGGDLGFQVAISPSAYGALVGGSVLYDFPSNTRWQLQLRATGLLGGAFGLGVAAEYDPPSSFFLTIPATVYVSGGGLTLWATVSLGWVWDFDGE